MIQIHSIPLPKKYMGRKPIRGRSKARNLVNAFSYSSAIVACGSAKRWQCALELWEAMTNRGPAPNVVAMNALLGTENHELMDRGMDLVVVHYHYLYIYRSNDINHIIDPFLKYETYWMWYKGFFYFFVAGGIVKSSNCNQPVCSIHHRGYARWLDGCSAT